VDILTIVLLFVYVWVDIRRCASRHSYWPFWVFHTWLKWSQESAVL